MGFRELLEKHRLKNKLRKINRKKYNIFVAYHKRSKIYESDIVTPIHAGRNVALAPIEGEAVSEKDRDWFISNMIGDESGINISDKNRYFNEMSAVYWMWKNNKSPYVGLFHYRRFLDFTEGEADKSQEKDDLKRYGINKKTLEPLLNEYDVLLPRKMGFTTTIYDVYKKHLDGSGEDIDFCFEYIKERYPQMYEFAEALKHTNVCYMFNIFVTSRKIFEGYADFVFDVLFALNRFIKDREQRSIYLKRAEGFMAERLTSIYFDYLIAKKNLKVKEFRVIRLDQREEESPKKSTLSFTKFAVKNSKGKGITMVLRIKL